MSNPNPNDRNPFQRMIDEQQARSRGLLQLLQSLQQRQQSLSNVVNNLQRTHDVVEQQMKNYDENFKKQVEQLNASLDQVIQSTLLLSQQSRQDADREMARFQEFFNQLGIDLNDPEAVRALMQFLQQQVNTQQYGDQQGGSGPSSSGPNN